MQDGAVLADIEVAPTAISRPSAGAALLLRAPTVAITASLAIELPWAGSSSRFTAFGVALRPVPGWRL